MLLRGGELRIAERPARPEEVGRRMHEVRGRLAVAVERDGKVLGFWSAAEEQIRAGDLVFAIESRDERSAP